MAPNITPYRLQSLARHDFVGTMQFLQIEVYDAAPSRFDDIAPHAPFGRCVFGG